MKKTRPILAVATIGTALAAHAYAEPTTSTAASITGETPELRAAAVVVPPFVIQQDGSLTGFSIELWNAIAGRLKLRTIYQIEPDGTALEGAMLSKRVDLSVTPIVVTSGRDERFDFSFPIMEVGMQIMVRGTHQKTAIDNPLWDMLRLILSRTTVVWLGMALLLVLIPAHVIWLLERGHKGGMIVSRKYFPGIFEAIWWALSTLVTQAETFPRQWMGRALSVIWMFAGVIFCALYTAQLTTSLTVEQIRGAIEGPDDLPNKRVATLANTVAVDYLRKHHALVQEFQSPDQVFNALLAKKVDAVVGEAPILRYYAVHEGKGRVKMVGPEIDIAPVAIMVQSGSLLRKKIDIALLTLHEDGSYQQIYDKWFGSP